jgi:hypothetical protein
LWGAALSGLATMLVVTVLQVAYVCRLFGDKWTRVLPLADLTKTVLLCCTCGAAAAFVQAWARKPMIGFLAGATIFAVAYLLLVVRLRLVTLEEQELLLSGLRSRLQAAGLGRAANA